MKESDDSSKPAGKPANRRGTPGGDAPRKGPSDALATIGGAGLSAKRSDLLAKLRSATPTKPLPGRVGGGLLDRRPRLVFAVDATASRSATWASAQTITDRMFDAIPGALDVALEVHGGGNVHTFTGFSADLHEFRKRASRVRCTSGHTRLVDLMQRTLDAGGVRVMSYIGDAFEESADEAFELADRFKHFGIKAVILADQADVSTMLIFEEIARRTGGAVLDFRSGDLDLMGEVLAGVAALAVGGRGMLESNSSKGSQLLLGCLKA